ncbi:unnamed protein product [Thelazia callipaeda]|uniref:Cerebral cavernous malformations 2 harmonin-homology domain-containing protein n=1 Tax=Thelazia callipaeda TaxID=103827 RepID=A0A3P7KRV2_THECL|nr:unnamed protein product [Thelazia callipaeda]
MLSYSLTESHQDLRISSCQPPDSTTASHSESAEIRISDVIEEYMTVLTQCLTTDELSQYASLIVRFRNGSLPIIELAQKSSELYGRKRLHLLTGMRCLLKNRSKEEIEAFDGFIDMLQCSRANSNT